MPVPLYEPVRANVARLRDEPGRLRGPLRRSPRPRSADRDGHGRVRRRADGPLRRYRRGGPRRSRCHASASTACSRPCSRHVPAIDVLKIDTEGAELATVGAIRDDLLGAYRAHLPRDDGAPGLHAGPFDAAFACDTLRAREPRASARDARRLATTRSSEARATAAGVAREPGGGRAAAAPGRRRARAGSPRRGPPGRPRRDEAVDALLDELDRRVVRARARRRSARRPPPPRPRSARSPRGARAAPCRARGAASRSTSSASTKPGASIALSSPSRADRGQHRRALRPVAEDHAAQLGQRRRGPGDRGHERAARASPGCGGRRTRRAARRLGLAAARAAPAYSPSSTVDLAAQPARPQAVAVQPREAERALRDAHAQRLDRVADRAAEPAEVLAPVLAAPDLVPVHDEPVAAEPAQRPRPPAARSTGTRRCGRRRSGARGAAGAQSTPAPNTSGGRMRRRPRPGVERHARPDRHRPARRRTTARSPRVPLAQREVGDLVAVGREALGEVAVPALGAADGPREQAVVDEADRACGGGEAVRRPFATSLRRIARLSALVAFIRSPEAAGLEARFHEHDSANDTSGRRVAPPRTRARRLGRDPLPQRGGEHRALRPHGARRAVARPAWPGEVVVADNALRRRQRRARRATPGARVVHEPRRGYGSAYLAGFAAARGRYIVMADADLTYDFDEIPRFVERARRRRRAGDGRPDGQHPPRARCRGCTATSATRCSPASSTSSSAPASSDAHCGMRAVRRDVLPRLDLRTTGMEFASEMVIRAAKEQLDDPRVPDRVPPARRRVEALELPRRLAPPALPARPQPDAPVRAARRGDGAARRR